MIIDLSLAMAEKDLRPTRYLLTLRYTIEFINAFFEQNPISQLSLIGMRDGRATYVSPMSGNPSDHTSALQALQKQEPQGAPSLQNALDMARGALFHSPSHGTREVIILFGALYSNDPGDIHRTVRDLVADSIRVNVVGLAARVAICQELCSKTNGVAKDDTTVYGVAMNETHYRELLMQYITPPATRGAKKTTAEAKSNANVPSLLKMGFPNLLEEEVQTMCACHGNATKTGYLCPQCKTKVCGLPAQCPGCSLQLIQSNHLARSYHHLFPLQNYVEVSWQEVRKSKRSGDTRYRRACVGCNVSIFPALPELQNGHVGNIEERTVPERKIVKGASESGRYRCRNCGYDYCIHCDVLFHQVIHNCPGCLGKMN